MIVFREPHGPRDHLVEGAAALAAAAAPAHRVKPGAEQQAEDNSHADAFGANSEQQAYGDADANGLFGQSIHFGFSPFAERRINPPSTAGHSHFFHAEDAIGGGGVAFVERLPAEAINCASMQAVNRPRRPSGNDEVSGAAASMIGNPVVAARALAEFARESGGTGTPAAVIPAGSVPVALPMGAAAEAKTAILEIASARVEIRLLRRYVAVRTGLPRHSRHRRVGVDLLRHQENAGERQRRPQRVRRFDCDPTEPPAGHIPPFNC